MSNQDITRLVIGESISLSMGVPVGQELRSTAVSNKLRWRDVSWAANVGLLDMVMKSLTKTPNVLQLPATRSPKKIQMRMAVRSHWKLAALASVGLVLCTVGIYGLLRHNKAPTDDLAVVLDANTTSLDEKMAAVTTVDEPWIRPAPEQPLAKVVDSGNAVPVVPGSLSRPAPAPVEVRTAAASKQTPVLVPESPKKGVEAKPFDQKAGDKKPGVPEAVILDMGPSPSTAKPNKPVDEPWIRPAPEQPPAKVVDSGNAVPVVPGSLPRPAPAPVEVRTAAAPKPTPVLVPESPKKGVEAKPVDQKAGDKKPDMPEAVILDLEPSPSTTKPKESTGVQVNTVKQPARELPKRATGSGLVAVTPDGKSALFTNTTTRLPEKFGIGDKLPSGEVIKSIDARAGIVKTDAKEYWLE